MNAKSRITDDILFFFLTENVGICLFLHQNVSFNIRKCVLDIASDEALSTKNCVYFSYFSMKPQPLPTPHPNPQYLA